jgi:hypothetical protein
MFIFSMIESFKNNKCDEIMSHIYLNILIINNQFQLNFFKK